MKISHDIKLHAQFKEHLKVRISQDFPRKVKILLYDIKTPLIRSLSVRDELFEAHSSTLVRYHTFLENIVQLSSGPRSVLVKQELGTLLQGLTFDVGITGN